MELFLNLVWCILSLLLIVHWTAAAKPRSNLKTGRAFVALLLLVVVLLPVISVTDDLVAMTSPVEVEHLVRRGDISMLHLDQMQTAMLDMGTLMAQLFIGLAFLASLLSRTVPRRSAGRLLDGFGAAGGIRPPPFAALSAA
ncbi:MAG: hypothetical protein JSS95_16815 [Acidobacteria bacterium]|nr:hypothetical protein [Acidobacteriota bacterium]